MNDVLKVVLYITLFLLISGVGYKLYTVLNKRIKSSKTGLEIIGYALLLFFACVFLLIGGLYLFIESYAFLSRQQP